MASSTILVSAAVLLSSVVLIFGASIGNTRIYGGKRAVTGQFPYVVAIVIDLPGICDKCLLCTGSILSDKFIVTAAHCNLDFFLFSPIRIMVGSAIRLSGESHRLKRFIRHPKYDFEHQNDIALIELSTPIKLSQNASTIALNREFVNENQDAVMAGFGFDDKEQDDNLNYANVKTLSDDVCRDKLSHDVFQIPDNSLCAMGVNHDKGACYGDAGSPLVHDNKLIGVSAWADCKGRIPSVYIRISKYVDWIQTTIAANK